VVKPTQESCVLPPATTAYSLLTGTAPQLPPPLLVVVVVVRPPIPLQWHLPSLLPLLLPSTMADAGWFYDAFGFPEFESFEDTRAAFTLEEKPPSLPPWLSTAPELVVRTHLWDERAFFVGPFETPSVRHPVPHSPSPPTSPSPLLSPSPAPSPSPSPLPSHAPSPSPSLSPSPSPSPSPYAIASHVHQLMRALGSWLQRAPFTLHPRVIHLKSDSRCIHEPCGLSAPPRPHRLPCAGGCPD